MGWMHLRPAALACCASLFLALPARAVEPTGAPAAEAESAEPGTLAALDEKRGFRDAKFGMTVKQFRGLSKPKREAGLAVYTRSTDSLTIGSGKLFLIRYGFKDGRLVAVFLDAYGDENSNAVLNALQAAYGPGEQENQFIREYKWNGEKVIMTFSQPPLRRNSTVVIVDREYVHQEVQRAAEKAENADL